MGPVDLMMDGGESVRSGRSERSERSHRSHGSNHHGGGGHHRHGNRQQVMNRVFCLLLVNNPDSVQFNPHQCYIKTKLEKE